MGLAVIVVALFWLIGGIGGGLLAWALAVPIGVVIGVIALAMGWFNR